MNKRTLSKRMLVGALALAVVATAVYGIVYRPGAARAVLLPPPTVPAPSCPQLPQNFDLATASEAQLSAYGLPTHDDVLADLPEWQDWLASQPQQDCDAPVASTYQPTPQPQESVAEPDVPASDLAPGVSVAGRQNLHWSGNAATGTSAPRLETTTGPR
jgi:hypothetical protein